MAIWKRVLICLAMGILIGIGVWRSTEMFGFIGAIIFALIAVIVIRGSLALRER